MTRRAWIQMSVLAALWGASYMFIKVAIDDVSPIIVVWVRLVLAALVLLPIAHSRGALAELRPHLPTILLLSVVQVAAPFLLITFGEQHIASALAGILVASAPIFTALLAFRLDREELATGWRLVGIMVGIVGVVLLFGVDLSGDSAALLGGLMVLLAAAGQLRLRNRPAPDEAQAPGRAAGRDRRGDDDGGSAAADARGAVRLAERRTGHRHGRLAARPRRGRDRRRVPDLLHADRGDRPGARDGRRLHRARLQRGLRRRPARRELHGRDRCGADVHPRRLVARRRREGQPKWTFPFDRARACARSMKSRRLSAARSSRVTNLSRAFSERRLSSPCLASSPKSTVAAMS
ncbi:MAG: DMT family transporter [Actinobacteria bacterium]|nr:MAG: DMT family transporter [Actinomycetota bacterium]